MPEAACAAPRTVQVSHICSSCALPCSWPEVPWASSYLQGRLRTCSELYRALVCRHSDAQEGSSCSDVPFLALDARCASPCNPVLCYQYDAWLLAVCRAWCLSSTNPDKHGVPASVARASALSSGSGQASASQGQLLLQLLDARQVASLSLTWNSCSTYKEIYSLVKQQSWWKVEDWACQNT